MKTSFLIGIGLAVLGTFIVIRGMSYNTQKTVMKVGDFHAAVQTDVAVPAWVGAVTIAAGVLLVGLSFRPARA